MEVNKIYHGDAETVLKTLPDKSIHCCVTSPPYYGLRDYGVKKTIWPLIEFYLFDLKITIPEMECCLGLEETPKQFIGHLVFIFREVKRVLKDDGTCWINIGDTYAAYWGQKYGQGQSLSCKRVINGSSPPAKKSPVFSKNKRDVDRYGGGNVPAADDIKPKDLFGIPWMLAFALRADGWYLRQDIIWNKLNPMPESVTDRCTKSHEYIFLLSKSPKYYYDAEAIKTPVKDSTVQRMMQQIETQKGSDRVPGKTNGTMKAVGPGRKKRFDIDNKGGNQGSETGIKAYAHRGTGDKKLTGHSGSFDNDGNLIGDGMANKKSVWTVSTKPFTEAHFATFPQDLIVDCIKAGTSEKGCCSLCGNPYIRIIEKELVPTKKASYNSKIDSRDIAADKNDHGSNRMKDGHKPGWVNRTDTLGWEAACNCNAEISSCIVLDPFMGACTTGLVARKLHRDFVGIELNQEYIAMGEKRLKKELGLFI